MAPKPSKEKKLKAPDTKSKATKSNCLTYMEMITEAVSLLHGRTGSGLPVTFDKELALQVLRGSNSSDTMKKPAAEKVLSTATRKSVKKSVKVPEPDVVKAKAEEFVKPHNVKAAKAKAVAKPANPKPADHPKPKPVKPVSGKKAAASPKKAPSTPKKSNKSVKRTSAKPKAPAAKKTKVSAD